MNMKIFELEKLLEVVRFAKENYKELTKEEYEVIENELMNELKELRNQASMKVRNKYK